MSDVVRDLDALRPPKQIIVLGGEQIDVTFIPTALTFDIDAVTQKMGTLDQAKINDQNGKELKRAFDLTIDLCVTFLSWKHPLMTREWLMENTDAGQIRVLGEAIRRALTRAYDGIDEDALKKTAAIE